MGKRGVRRVRPDLLQLLLRREDGGDRPVVLHQLFDDAFRQGRPAGVRRPAVGVHEGIAPPVGDQVAIAGHFEIARVFAEKGDRGHAAALEGEGLAVGQLDDAGKAQLPQEREVIVIQRSAISAARHDDRDVLRHGQQRPRVHVVVVVMGQEDGSRPREQGVPQRRDRRFGQPGHQPRIEQEELVLSAIEERSMAEVDEVAVLREGKPVGVQGCAWGYGQTLHPVEGFQEFGQGTCMTGP